MNAQIKDARQVSTGRERIATVKASGDAYIVLYRRLPTDGSPELVYCKEVTGASERGLRFAREVRTFKHDSVEITEHRVDPALANRLVKQHMAREKIERSKVTIVIDEAGYLSYEQLPAEVVVAPPPPRPRFECPICGGHDTVADVPRATLHQTYDRNREVVSSRVMQGLVLERERCAACDTPVGDDWWVVKQPVKQ